jgi:hypothetical protein
VSAQLRGGHLVKLAEKVFDLWREMIVAQRIPSARLQVKALRLRVPRRGASPAAPEANAKAAMQNARASRQARFVVQTEQKQ